MDRRTDRVIPLPFRDYCLRGVKKIKNAQLRKNKIWRSKTWHK